jgi:FkbM family methyltransferase
MPFPSSTTILGRLLRWPLRVVPRERPVPILGGPLRGWRWIPAAAPHGCWLGVFERTEQQVFANIVRPNDVVYDLGANVGFYALLAAKLGARVLAFEPVARNLAYLRRHIELNECENVTIVAAAVSDHSGTAHFREGPAPTVGALVDDDSAGYDVPVVALDDIVGTPVPQLVKIDVEGAEAAVLHGAHRLLHEARPTVLLSTHSTALRHECVSILHEARYDVRPLGGDQADLIATPAMA